jgi:hypothetical protein
MRRISLVLLAAATMMWLKMPSLRLASLGRHAQTRSSARLTLAQDDSGSDQADVTPGDSGEQVEPDSSGDSDQQADQGSSDDSSDNGSDSGQPSDDQGADSGESSN